MIGEKQAADLSSDRTEISRVNPEPKAAYAIEFDNVSRHYRLQHEATLTLQDRMINLFKRRNTYEDFWALKGVSFKLEKGKALGIIGRNGAGKSTLLKLATRILEPTGGVIRVNGRVSAMLELGTGFHPELSARDNIFLNGAFYGYNTKQMEERYDQIVEFSELGKFIDTPVKHYSTGMYMRLGFAVAITINPDILIVDEVLAVGDAAFGRKCHRAIEELKQQSKAMLFVSHAAGEISRFCDEVIYLEKGQIVAQGKPGEVLDEYMMQSLGPSYFTSNLTTQKESEIPVKELASPNKSSQTSAELAPNKMGANKGLISPLTPSITGAGKAVEPLLSIEELMLTVGSPKAASPLIELNQLDLSKYCLPVPGVYWPNTLWQFELPAKPTQNEFYLSVINPNLTPLQLSITGYKTTGSQLDEAAGALRTLPIGTFTAAPHHTLLIKLEEATLRNVHLLKLVSSTPVVAELVEYEPGNKPKLLRLENTIQPVNVVGTALNWFFPFCDIRADNQCRFRIFNPNEVAVEIYLTLYMDWTNPVSRLRTYRIEANARLTLNLNEELAGGEGERHHGERFYGGLLIESTSPVVAERYALQLTSPHYNLKNIS